MTPFSVPDSTLNLAPPWRECLEAPLEFRARNKENYRPNKKFNVAPPAEPRGEKKLFFVQILGGEKLLKFGEKWAVKNF